MLQQIPENHPALSIGILSLSLRSLLSSSSKICGIAWKFLAFHSLPAEILVPACSLSVEFKQVGSSGVALSSTGVFPWKQDTRCNLEPSIPSFPGAFHLPFHQEWQISQCNSLIAVSKYGNTTLNEHFPCFFFPSGTCLLGISWPGGFITTTYLSDPEFRSRQAAGQNPYPCSFGIKCRIPQATLKHLNWIMGKKQENSGHSYYSSVQ